MSPSSISSILSMFGSTLLSFSLPWFLLCHLFFNSFNSISVGFVVFFSLSIFAMFHSKLSLLSDNVDNVIKTSRAVCWFEKQSIFIRQYYAVRFKVTFVGFDTLIIRQHYYGIHFLYTAFSSLAHIFNRKRKDFLEDRGKIWLFTMPTVTGNFT